MGELISNFDNSGDKLKTYLIRNDNNYHNLKFGRLSLHASDTSIKIKGRVGEFLCLYKEMGFFEISINIDDKIALSPTQAESLIIYSDEYGYQIFYKRKKITKYILLRLK